MDGNLLTSQKQQQKQHKMSNGSITLKENKVTYLFSIFTFLFFANNDIYNYKLSRRSSDDDFFFSILILVIIIVRGHHENSLQFYFNWERVSIYLHTKK